MCGREGEGAERTDSVSPHHPQDTAGMDSMVAGSMTWILCFWNWSWAFYVLEIIRASCQGPQATCRRAGVFLNF